MTISDKVRDMTPGQLHRLKVRIKEIANNNSCARGIDDEITYMQLTSPPRRKFIRTIYGITDDDINYIMQNGKN